MKETRMKRIAMQLSEGGVITVREGEMKEYHKRVLELLDTMPVVRCRECRFSMKPCAEEMRDKQVYCQLYRQLKALVGYCDHGARMYGEGKKHAE